jgi:hypothetical protein
MASFNSDQAAQLVVGVGLGDLWKENEKNTGLWGMGESFLSI